MSTTGTHRGQRIVLQRAWTSGIGAGSFERNRRIKTEKYTEDGRFGRSKALSLEERLLIHARTVLVCMK